MTAQPRSNKRAFTLIEIMIVIGIIAIMSATLISVLNPAKQFAKARDAQRRSHLAVITAALEQYYADNNGYPVATGSMTGANGITCLRQALLNRDLDCNGSADATADQYLKIMPSDPKSTNSYCYLSPIPPSTSRQDFILCSITELGDNTIPTGMTSCSPTVAVSGRTGVFCLTSPF